jgi:hypothetical protein
MSEHVRIIVDAETAERVARLLRLIFLTDDDPNEVLRAVTVVRNLLAGVGLDGFYLAAAFSRGAAGPFDHDDILDFEIKVAMQAPDILSPKEAAFLGVLANRDADYLVSDKQTKWLADIVERVLSKRRAAV